jgi:hypothetical protein
VFVIVLSAFKKMQNIFVEDVSSEPIAQRNARGWTGKDPDKTTNSGNEVSMLFE